MTRKIGRDIQSERVDEHDPEAETIVFLGKLMSRDEYDIASRNLREFFDLLKSWREGDTDEPSKL